MPYYDDLDGCEYLESRLSRAFPCARATIRAVGFLDNSLPGPPAEADERLRLSRALANHWNAAHEHPLGIEMGNHGCGLCNAPPDRAPATHLELDGSRLTLGSGYIIVPTASELLVAPSLVIHYVLVHGYRPPVAFIAALTECPTPGSSGYARAMRRVGPWAWRYIELSGTRPSWWRKLAFERVETWDVPPSARQRMFAAVLSRL